MEPMPSQGRQMQRRGSTHGTHALPRGGRCREGGQPMEPMPSQGQHRCREGFQPMPSQGQQMQRRLSTHAGPLRSHKCTKVVNSCPLKGGRCIKGGQPMPSQGPQRHRRWSTHALNGGTGQPMPPQRRQLHKRWSTHALTGATDTSKMVNSCSPTAADGEKSVNIHFHGIQI
jgi:hypothetical protein